MPTYEYVCEKCGKSFDKFQSMNDARLTTCIFEGCGGTVRRKIGRGAGIIFKGGGFYETDYRSEAYKAAAKGDSGAGSGSGEGASTGKSESTTGGEKSAPAKEKSTSTSPPAKPAPAPKAAGSE